MERSWRSSAREDIMSKLKQATSMTEMAGTHDHPPMSKAELQHLYKRQRLHLYKCQRLHRHKHQRQRQSPGDAPVEGRNENQHGSTTISNYRVQKF